jgi:hypothetical protein
MREAYLTGDNIHFDATGTPAAPKPAEDLGLTKVKLNRKDSTLYAEYSEGEAGGYAEKTALHHRPAHADLEAAFARVLPHFLLMLEMLPGVQVGEEWLKNDTQRFRLMLEDGELHELPECKDYQLTGYAYSDKGGVVLLGRKTTRFGKVINLTTPHEVMDPEQPTGMEYEHLFTLGTELGACDKEVKLYLGGKSAPYVAPQQTDFLEELQSTVDNAGGYTSLTISSGGKSVTISKKKSGKDAAAGSDD